MMASSYLSSYHALRPCARKNSRHAVRASITRTVFAHFGLSSRCPCTAFHAPRRAVRASITRTHFSHFGLSSRCPCTAFHAPRHAVRASITRTVFVHFGLSSHCPCLAFHAALFIFCVTPWLRPHPIRRCSPKSRNGASARR